MKQYRVEIIKFTEQDKYDQGCIPETIQNHGLVFKFQSSDIEMIKQRIENYTNVKLSQCELYPDGINRLEFQCLEDGNGTIASQAKIEGWKNSSIDLFNAMYSIYVTLVTIEDIDASILK